MELIELLPLVGKEVIGVTRFSKLIITPPLSQLIAL
jgi:hypothetical protein